MNSIRRLLYVLGMFSLLSVVPGLSQSQEVAKLPSEQPEVLWKYVSNTRVMPDGTAKMVQLTGVAVAEGAVYFGDDNGDIFALKSSDGTPVWKHAYADRVMTPSVDMEHVYFAWEDGVMAVRRDNGERVWRHEIDKGGTGMTPLPLGDRIYVSGYDGNAYALDQKTGAVKWKHDFAADAPPDKPGFEGKRARFQEIVARPYGAACDGKIFVQCVFDQSRVIGLDCATGKRLWTFQADGWMSADPILVEDRIYVASQDSHLYCLARDTGTVIWKFKTPDWFSTEAAVHEGKVFLTHHRGRFYTLDAASGELNKMFQPMDEIEGKSLHGSSPLVAGGIACFTTAKGRLYGIDIKDSAVLWQFRPSEASELHGNIVFDGRRLYMTCNQDLKHAGECAILAIGQKR